MGEEGESELASRYREHDGQWCATDDVGSSTAAGRSCTRGTPVKRLAAEKFELFDTEKLGASPEAVLAEGESHVGRGTRLEASVFLDFDFSPGGRRRLTAAAY